MSTYGMQLFHTDGTKMLDTSHRCLRLWGVYSFTVPYAVASGTVTVTGMVNDGTWIVAGAPAGLVAIQINTGHFTWIPVNTAGPFTVSIAVMRY